jgi:hypothetical protein
MVSGSGVTARALLGNTVSALWILEVLPGGVTGMGEETAKPDKSEGAVMDITTQCPTCTRSKYDPFRRYDERDRVIAGCIDDFHTGHLTPISASNDWHNRKFAKAHRRAIREHLHTLRPYAEARV